VTRTVNEPSELGGRDDAIPSNLVSRPRSWSPSAAMQRVGSVCAGFRLRAWKPPVAAEWNAPSFPVDGPDEGPSTRTASWRIVADGTLWRRWTSRGGWALFDHGLFTASNFVLSVLLARWLTPAEYGAYVASYAVLLLFSVVHTAVVTEPLFVFGAGRYGGRFPEYLRIVIREHFRLTTVALLALVLVGGVLWMLGFPLLGGAIAGMGLATPAILLAWLARRVCYSQGKPRVAAEVSIVHFALTITGICALYATSLLSVFAGQLVLALATLAGSIRPLRQFSNRRASSSFEDRSQIRTEHWQYGRWGIGTGALQWLHLHSWVLVTVPLIGVEGSGELRALLNLVFPMLHLNMAASGILVPAFIRARNSPGRLQQVVIITLLFSLGPSIVYGVAVLVGGGVALATLSGGVYHATTAVLIVLAFLPLFFGLSNIIGAAVMALEQPKALFRADLAAAAVAVPLGSLAIGAWGVAGALAAILCASAVQTVVNSWSLRGLIDRMPVRGISSPYEAPS
jgi:hypothetical protein